MKTFQQFTISLLSLFWFLMKLKKMKNWSIEVLVKENIFCVFWMKRKEAIKTK